tara:strand:+ start:1296 stop:1484 length:189 start_codon:yes stop_codon:yes gene_type:complete
MTKDSAYYNITYINEYEPSEVRTTLISTPHSVERTKRILAEVHPEWDIISVLPSSYKEPIEE